MAKRRASPTEIALPEGHPLAAEVRDALVRARAEVLSELYEGWQRLRLAQGSAAAQAERESSRMEAGASYVLASIESARSLGAPHGNALAKREVAGPGDAGYRAASADAQRDLDRARERLRRRVQSERRFFARAIEEVKRSISDRVEAMARHLPPRLSVEARPVGGERVLLHLARPEPDAALLWSHVLAGKLPTRYGAFFDDAVDELPLAPARLYAEEGNPTARPGSADAEDAIALAPESLFVPVKAMLAFKVPGRDFPRFRIVNRGPLAEVEAREAGSDYANLVPRAVAELFTGYLIRLRMEKKLELALALG